MTASKLNHTMRVQVAFWAGVAVAASAHGLFQDLIGEREYVAYVREHWVSAWITAPISVVVMTIAVLLYIGVKKMATDDDVETIAKTINKSPEYNISKSDDGTQVVVTNESGEVVYFAKSTSREH